MNRRSPSYSRSPEHTERTGKRERIFGRHARLRTQAQFGLMKRRGRTVAERTCVVSAITPPPDAARRVGFIVSRRYCAKAVGRNRARRLLREAYRQLYGELRPAWLALIPRARMRGAKLGEVLRDLREACGELGLLRDATRAQEVER